MVAAYTAVNLVVTIDNTLLVIVIGVLEPLPEVTGRCTLKSRHEVLRSHHADIDQVNQHSLAKGSPSSTFPVMSTHSRERIE